MAKKKKTSKKSTKKPASNLPSGFWRQVGAVILVVLALLIVLTWFKAGGPVIDAIQKFNLAIFGYGVFFVPLMLTYWSIEIFHDQENKLPVSSFISSVFLIILISSLAGLLFSSTEISTGGVIGELVNKMMRLVVIDGIAIFLYLIIIIITLLFMLRVSPFAFIKQLQKIFSSLPGKAIEGLKLKKAQKDQKQAKDDYKKPKFELVEGVPTVSKKPEIVEEGPLKTKTFKVKDGLGKLSEKKVSSTAHQEPTALVSVRDTNWELPPLKFLSSKQSPADAGDIKGNADIIKNTMHEFNIDVEMTGANIGPKVTQYTLTPPSGVKLTKIAALENNIALNLAAKSLRIEAPIPGKRAVGIEVPNVKAADVRIRSLLESDEWKNDDGKLNFVLGRDISGKAVIEDLSTMPHLLIAGQTGSGKSVMINTLLTSLLYSNSPSELKLILVDPKQVEMAPYEDIPHLITPIITDPAKTISALKWAVNEMERRYKLLASEKKRDISSYNEYITAKNKTVEIPDQNGNLQEHEDGAMPYVVIVIDEMADLMMTAARDVETLISRIAAKARAVGIHLVLATQRPSVNVVTGLIKANVPARIAFTVASQIDSRTILDQVGAEKLLGKGDMLITTTKITKPYRVQGALVTDDEVVKITDYLRMQMPPQYNDEIINQAVNLGGSGGAIGGADGAADEQIINAAKVILESGKASTSFLQRKLRVGYNRAALIMEELEERGVVSQQDSSRKREILISSVDEINQ